MRTQHYHKPTTIPCKDERGVIKNKPGIKRRFEVKLCTECDRVFENYCIASKRERVDYYDSFPKLHLEKGVCLICQRK